MKKKIFTTLLVATMIVSLVACGSADDAAEAPADEVTETIVEETNAEADETTEAVAETQVNEGTEHLENGRASLYGLDGTELNLENAYNEFAKAVELGNVGANFYLGLLYDWYKYPEQDFNMAKKYYEACGDNVYAKINLAFLYCYGDGVAEDKEKAKTMFQEAVDQGYAEGYLGYGCMAKDEEDYAAAFEYHNKAMEGTEQVYLAWTANRIGVMYESGTGVEQDYTQALEWYEKAADLGQITAMGNIGALYMDGNGVEQDYAKALEWYEKAADLGNAYAMNDIGFMYYVGNGVEQDYTQAAEWFERAFENGNSTGASNVGRMYFDGVGVEQDYAMALQWYEKAVDMGHAGAMNELGWMYQNGLGVEEDWSKAFEYYKMAADLEEPTGMNNVGFFYENGMGVEQDYEKALEYYDMAAELGSEGGKLNGDRLRQQIQ